MSLLGLTSGCTGGTRQTSAPQRPGTPATPATSAHGSQTAVDAAVNPEPNPNTPPNTTNPPTPESANSEPDPPTAAGFPTGREANPRIRINGLPEDPYDISFTIREIPALSADGKRVLQVFDDLDGGRRYPDYTLLVSDVSSCSVSEKQRIVDPDEVEAGEGLNDRLRSVRANIRKRLDAVDALISAETWYQPGTELQQLAVFDDDIGRPLSTVLTADDDQDDVYVFMDDGPLWLASTTHGFWHPLDVCNLVQPGWGVTVPHEDDCSNVPWVNRGWVDTAVSRTLILEVGWTGNDFCWEPGNMLLAETLPDDPPFPPATSLAQGSNSPDGEALEETLQLPPFRLFGPIDASDVSHLSDARRRNADGVRLARAGKAEDAEEAYRDAIQQDPSLALARSNLAALYATQNRLEDALALLSDLGAAAGDCLHCGHLLLHTAADEDFAALRDHPTLQQWVKSPEVARATSTDLPVWDVVMRKAARAVLWEQIIGNPVGMRLALQAGYPVAITHPSQGPWLLTGDTEEDEVRRALPDPGWSVRVQNMEEVPSPAIDCTWRCCSYSWAGPDRCTFETDEGMVSTTNPVLSEVCFLPVDQNTVVPTELHFTDCPAGE